MKNIKVRMMVKSIKRINKQARVLTRGVSVRKRTTRNTEHQGAASSSEQIQDRIDSNAHRAANTVIHVPMAMMVKISWRWRSRDRFQYGRQYDKADSQQQPMIRAQLRRIPPNGKGPRLAKRKRMRSPAKETARHLIREQPTDKKKGIASNHPRTTRFHDGKAKAYTPRQKNKAGSSTSVPGIKKKQSSILQKRSVKVIARSIKLSRSAIEGTSQAEKHSTQQRQKLQAVMQARRSIQWSRAAARMNLRMVKLLIKAITLVVKGLSVMLGISSSRTAEQQAALYGFSTEQVDLTNELLSVEFRPMMMAILGKNGDTGLTSEQSAAVISDLPAGVLGSQAVELALTRLGDPYSQLKVGKDNYTDCSYLVQWVYRQLGVEVPRTAAEQARFIAENGLSLTSNELIAGDLIF